MDTSSSRLAVVTENAEGALGSEEQAEPPGRGHRAVLERASTARAGRASSIVGREAFDATDEQWADWRWQMSHRLRTLEDFQSVLHLTGEEIDGLTIACQKFVVGVPPYWVSLMDRDDPACPIRRQVVPSVKELIVSPTDMEDPCGEEHDMKTPGLVHRYPDRVLFLASDQCAGYCRYCTRSRLVGNGEEPVPALGASRTVTITKDKVISPREKVVTIHGALSPADCHGAHIHDY